MAINKNFVVKNGIQVGDNVLYVDSASKNVGLGTTSPQSKLDVIGNIKSTSIDSTNENISGISTINTAFISNLTATNITGTAATFTNMTVNTNLTVNGTITAAGGGAIGAPVVDNVYYVTKNGNDSNTGKSLSDAKATIKSAVQAVADKPGSVIKVSAGTYTENNPIVLPDQISIVGDNLREVSIVPQNQGDVFYVGNGNYISNVSFVGSANTGAIFAFNPQSPKYINQSTYVQNCTNFIPESIGMKIDGQYAIGPLKSMVLDSYTQYNQGGIGVSITNEGYAQLVSLFTIADDIAVYCGSGGGCDLTNSNSSFGTFGLVADGVSPLKYTGVITATSPAQSTSFAINVSTPTLSITTAYYNNTTGILTAFTNAPHKFNVGMGVSIVGLAFTCPSGPGIVTYPSGNNGYIFEVASNTPVSAGSTEFSVYVGTSTLPHTYVSGGTVKVNVVRPFDGQVIYFGDLYKTVESINIQNSGSGYTSPPLVQIDPPTTPWGIPATAVAEIQNGKVSNIVLISSGRGYTTTPNITITTTEVGVTTATAVAQINPQYYAIEESTEIVSGICTVTVSEQVPYSVGIGTTVYFFKQSKVLATGHSFEYIGSGSAIPSALPMKGGVPVQENETVSKDGGLVVYTSTDQSGNFRIGDGVVINQRTGNISGQFYSKSLFASVTPFILALGG